MSRVLIIEDDFWLGSVFKRAVERAGHQAALIGDSRQAIDSIDDDPPEAIILDLLLGHTTAPALLHELQSHHDLAKIPVLLVTNIAERVDAELAKQYGVRAVLDKASVTPERLVSELEAVL